MTLHRQGNILVCSQHLTYEGSEGLSIFIKIQTNGFLFSPQTSLEETPIFS